jgi:hypothetical protein
MAKAKAAAGTPAPAAKASQAASADTLAKLDQGLKPYTLLAGRHHLTVEGADGAPPELSKPYIAGDVIWSKEDLAAKWPERFVPGETMPGVLGVVEAPGLGESLNEAIDTNGYDVYTKSGVIWAYIPGKYGSPASGALVDLVAAEEWCAANPIGG